MKQSDTDFNPTQGEEVKLIVEYIKKRKLGEVPDEYLVPAYLSQRVGSKGMTVLLLAVWTRLIGKIPKSILQEMDLCQCEATRNAFEYIEVFYNRFREHSSLGYQSPIQFERKICPMGQ